VVFSPIYFEVMQQNFKENIAKQRQGILAKYDKGPNKNNSDDWENPQYPIYATTDYYGFIQYFYFSIFELTTVIIFKIQ